MKYEVIARRYRPRQFEEVVGQESLAQTLRGGILQERLAHAYLFCGPRGVGKTSMARIFAKALNCAAAADRSGDKESWGRPCDSCSTCAAIHTGQDIDVIEMDGASHRGIDDVRQIIDGINRPATRGLYKIYLIDEVHMLTREAFNALLKTLEEPPSHVKFIFATTEPHKIPDTVLSRCQRFDFHPIGPDDIVRRLRQICETEGRECSDDLLEKIARYGKGGLRDAQTLLDQLMTYSGETLEADDLDRITGRVPDSAVDELVTAVLERRPAGVLERYRQCSACGADPAVLLEQLIEELHGRLVERVRSQEATEEPSAPRDADRLDAGTIDTATIDTATIDTATIDTATIDTATIDTMTIDTMIGALQILLETATRLRNAAYPHVVAEVALLKLSRLEDPRGLQRAIDGLASLEHASPPPTSGSSVPAAPAGGSLPPRPPLAPQPPQAAVSPQATVPSRPPQVPPSPGDSSPSAPHPGPIGSASSPPAPPGPQTDAPPERSAADRRPCDAHRLRSLWEQVQIEMRSRHPDVAPYISDARTVTAAGDNGGSDTLTLIFHNDFHWRQMKLKRRIESCQQVIREVTGEPWRVRLEYAPDDGDEREAPPGTRQPPAEKAAAPPAPPATPATPGPTAAPQAEPESAPVAPPAPSAEDLAKLRDHPLVKKSVDLFNGHLL